MEFFVVLLLIVLLVVLIRLSGRVRGLEKQVEAEAHRRLSYSDLIAGLTMRVRALEQARIAPIEAPAPPVRPIEAPAASEPQPLAPPAKVVAPPTEAAPPRPAPPPLPEQIVEPALVVEPARIFAPAISAVPVPPPLPEPVSREKWSEGWEAKVGGNWLNKLGVLVLVIGIALLLGYEFSHVGPAGRVGIGLSVSLAMLVGGVLLERKPVYAMFARGLMGGGWSALYFTTYAMYGVEAAKVIDNAYAATLLLLAVALAMILHSLRYKSQTVSALAYFGAFATLALSASTPFSVVSLIPLAASLLYLAHRFGWYKMAVFGLFATYATCASRPDEGAALGSTQALFVAYWLLFETFDLLRLRRRDSGLRMESLILPLNALGFLALSGVKWQRAAPEHLHLFLGGVAALYTASALLRVWLRPPASMPDTDTRARMAAGGYEGPITIAAVSAALSIFRGAVGMWVNAGLLIEGELLFLAGWRFGQIYLRQLAGATFGISLIKLLEVDLPSGNKITLAGRSSMVSAWTPVTACTAAVFYLNRMLRVKEGAVYSSFAAGLMVLILGVEMPLLYAGIAWLVFGAMLLEFGLRIRRTEFRYQSYFVSTAGFLHLFYFHVLRAHKGSGSAEPVALGIAALLCCGLAARVFRLQPGLMGEGERGWCRDANAAAGTLFIVTLTWVTLPVSVVALAWAITGLLVLELGFTFSLARFRLIGNIVAASAFGRLFLANFTDLGETLHVSHRILTVVPIALSQYYLWWRYRHANDTRVAGAGIRGRELSIARLYVYAPAILGVVLIRFELGRTLAIVGWSLLMLALYGAGRARDLADLRWQSYVVALLAFWRSWNTNFYIPESLAGISGRILTEAAVIACFYAAQLLSPDDSSISPDDSSSGGSLWSLPDRYARAYYSLLSSVLLAVLLFYEVSGEVLTMAWGAEAVALLGAGLSLRDRPQRLSGLFLFLVCILKLFLYDLRQLETLNRILSFLVLGVILLSVSWLYTRFRDRIQRYL